jgi:NAD(P)-dependent dehydrogenase (short-subunit alcohol dehydrogenase family)
VLEFGEQAGQRGPLGGRERADQMCLVLEQLATVSSMRPWPASVSLTETARRDTEQPADLEHVMLAWRANLDANLLSAVLTPTAVLGKLRAGGSIINVGSIGAEYASTSYGAAKAALAAWTAGLSAEAGPRGLIANVISPGYIAGTDFFRGTRSGGLR